MILFAVSVLLLIGFPNQIEAATFSQSGTYTPSPTYSTSGTATYSGSTSNSVSLTQTGTYSTSLTNTMSYTSSIKASPPFGVVPPGIISRSATLSVNAGPRQKELSVCDNAQKDPKENCDYYLDKTNKCCTTSCHFTNGGKKCAQSYNCWRYARCTAYGQCRGRKPKSKGAPCKQPTNLLNGMCNGKGLCTPMSPAQAKYHQKKKNPRRAALLALKRLALEKKLNLDLASQEEEEDLEKEDLKENDGQEETLDLKLNTI